MSPDFLVLVVCSENNQNGKNFEDGPKKSIARQQQSEEHEPRQEVFRLDWHGLFVEVCRIFAEPFVEKMSGKLTSISWLT